MNGSGHHESGNVPRTRPLAPFAVVAELSVLYEIASLGQAESEDQLGHEAAEKVSRLFGARYFAILRGPLLQQKPVVLWGVSTEEELKEHLLHPKPNQFRFSFPLGGDETATIFVEQMRPLDGRQLRLYTILARRIQTAMVTLKNAADRARAVEALTRHQARLESVVRYMGDGLIVADAEGRIELMNPAAESMTGWARDEARGKPLSEVFLLSEEKDRRPLEEILNRLLQGEHLIPFDERSVLISRDGTKRTIAGSAATLQDEFGEVSGCVLNFSDRTAEFRLQAERLESLRKAQMYLDVAAVILLALDRAGRITLINRKGEEILKVKAADVVGLDWFEQFTPESERTNLRNVFFKILEGEESAAFAYHENKVLCRDGTERLIGWHNALLRDSNGQIVGTLSSGTDITEMREVQAKMAAQLDELRRWYRITLGREEFVTQLKKEINELCERLGEPPRYQIAR